MKWDVEADRFSRMSGYNSSSSTRSSSSFGSPSCLTPNSTSDQSMEDLDSSPRRSRPLDASSSSNQSMSSRSSSKEPRGLSAEEDPGPGTVKVQVSDNLTVHHLDKRSLALKSEYFRSYLVRFHTTIDNSSSDEKTVELNSDFVSSEAWAVIKDYVESGELHLQDEV